MQHGMGGIDNTMDRTGQDMIQHDSRLFARLRRTYVECFALLNLAAYIPYTYTYIHTHRWHHRWQHR